MNSSKCNRRSFLGTSAVVLAAAGTVPYWFTARSASADVPESKNDRPLLGAIGVGGQGTVISGAGADWWGGKGANVFGHIVAVCDVDRHHADAAKEEFGGKADVYEDYRKLLDRKDIEAVTIATPDHWHTAIAIAAMKAGKDVYCEKPLTLTVDEGKLLCKVAKETGAMFQVGTQQRSDWKFRQAVELVRNGRIGKLKKVAVTLPDHAMRGGPFQNKPVPPQLNWDFWLGQAPKVPYCPKRCHFTFRGWLEYSGGIMTDWGQHHMDIAHWGMDCENSGPVTIDGKGVLPNIPNGMNVPTWFQVDLRYPNDVLLQVRINTQTRGVMFEGDKGRLFVNRARVSGKPVEELKDNPLPDNAIRVYKSDSHMGNFIECIKTRKTPISNVWVGHRVVTACHLANISIRLGRKLTWDAEKEQIVGDDEANTWLTREQRKPYQIEA